VSKHTPGPWKWWTTHEGSHRINPEEGGLVIASCDTRNPFSYEQEANARLIAAAPDLLAACIRGRQKLATYRGVFAGDRELEHLLVAWDAAIAKAEEAE